MRMKIRYVVATCQAFSPILFNPMTGPTLKGLRTGIHPQNPKDREPSDIAKDRLPLWTDPSDGIEYIGAPTSYLFAALNGAGREVKQGKSKLATAKSSKVPSVIWIDDQFLKFGPSSDVAWIVDERRGVIPKDQIAVCLVRPMIHNWGFTTHLRFDEVFVSTETVLKLVEYAGRFMGLGDYRPDKKGPYGQFIVTKFVVDDVEFDLDKWNSEPEPEIEELAEAIGEPVEGDVGEELVGAGVEGVGNGARSGRRSTRRTK